MVYDRESNPKTLYVQITHEIDHGIGQKIGHV
jgi:hypothetical protein